MQQHQISAAELTRLVRPTPFRAPVYRDLADRVRLLVLDGQLVGGDRLPSERELGPELGLSRTTVAAAYRSLREHGVVRSRRGAGNFVARGAEPPPSAVLPMPGLDRSSGAISMSTACSPAPPGVGAAYARAAEQLPALLGGTGYYPDGLPRLREAVADWFGDRGVPTGPEQVVVTAGALAALNVVVRALGAPGQPVLVESPSYVNALAVLANHRCRVVGVPTTARTGWDLDLFGRLLARHRPRLAYLISEFQNPTGAWPDDPDRERAAAMLRRHDVVSVVDESLVELGLDGLPARRPMASFPGPLITIGSASKTFWGGLRIGWIRAPRSLVPALLTAQASLDLGTPPLEQLVVAELLADSADLLARRRDVLRGQRDLLLAELAGRIPAWTTSSPPGGLSLWYDLGSPVSELLVAAARQRGLLLTAGTRFHVPGTPVSRQDPRGRDPRGQDPRGQGERRAGSRQLRIPFVAEPQQLREAARRLAEVWSELHDETSTAAAQPAADLLV